MIVLRWEGKAISENERLKPGKNRFYSGREYKAFKEGMAAIFRTQSSGKKFAHPSVIINMEIGSRKDKSNLIKAILDALQLSGVIGNDRDLNEGWLHILPSVVHPKGENDKIIVLLRGK